MSNIYSIKLRWLRLRGKQMYRWWRSNDHRYGRVWRIGNGFAALLVLASIVIPVAGNVLQQNRYKLSADTLKLVGKTDTRLSKQLTYDDSTSTYQFNKAAVKSSTTVPAGLQSRVGDTTKKGESQYALDLPKDITKGVTYHDINSQLSFSLVPEFKASQGQEQEGHLVYPLSDGSQAIYTLKNNGLKEDIVVQKPTSDTMTFSYKLNLPKTLEAKAIPNSGGAIGIYSADPSLFGNITYGSDKDQTLIEKARENGDKTFLMFGIPAPVIKAVDGASLGQASARFKLSGNKLAVIAENLSDVHTPITIDPSVIITSTSDFQTGGNNEGMIDFSASNKITRGGLTGGSIGAWTSGNSFTGTVEQAGAVAYNGYLYQIGGRDRNIPTTYSSVQYAQLNSSNGSLGTWQSATSLPVATWFHAVVAYNGYLYTVGGAAGGGVRVYFTPIGANGVPGSWTLTSSLPTNTQGLAAVAYNGYIYALGGAVTPGGCGGACYNTVYFAAINANGTVGTWNSTTSFTNGRAFLTAAAYNGYIYIMGGGNASFLNDVQYAPINADGTVGTWTATTSFTTSRYGQVSSVYNGYMYISGGWAGGVNYKNDVQYAPINANGTIGSWQTTSTFTTGRVYATGGFYNGYLYLMGGYDGTNDYADVQYAKIDSVGQITPFTSFTPTNKFTARSLACSVAYNGFLYVIGGSTTDSGGDIITNYYTPISSTGTLSNWTAVTSLPASNGTAGAGCAAYNGNLYLLGGTLNGITKTNISRIVPINGDGTLGTWTTTNALPFAIRFPGVFIYAGNIYALGPYAGGSDSVYHAPLNTNGTIGTWVADTNLIWNADTASAVTRVGNYVYYIGGSDLGTTVFDHVEYALINANGTITSWTSATSLPAALGYTQATTVNGCIYVLGGEDGPGTSLNVGYYTCPASNGSIGSWQTLPTLVTATTDGAITSYNGVVYDVGGYSTSTQQYTQLATVNNGGSGQTDTWSTGTGTLAAADYLVGSTAYNGYAYIVGGDNGSTNDAVQYAPLATNGNVGSFTTDSQHFTGGREDFGTVAYNGYLYVIGGVNNSGSTFYKDVQYAPIGSSGALSAGFTTGADYAASGRQGACTLAYNGYMYIVGGWDNTTDHADTLYAPINANGSLGTWADSGNNFTTVRSEAKCFTANGYMYLLGGNGAANYNDVQSALINSNGTLGTWRATTSFHTPRYNATVGVSNGFAYIYGGCTSGSTCSGELNDLQFAPINAGGALGNWQHSTTFTTARGQAGGFAYNGYLYIMGGCSTASCGTPLSDTQYTPLSAIVRSAKYSKLIDLGASMSLTSITYNGTLPASSLIPGVPPISFKTAGSNGVFGSSTNSNAIVAGATSCLATSINYARYLLVTINLDDSDGSGSGIFPDANSTSASLTDFTVNSITPHPAPNIRMRLGQTLQSGSISALDTCAP